MLALPLSRQQPCLVNCIAVILFRSCSALLFVFLEALAEVGKQNTDELGVLDRAAVVLVKGLHGISNHLVEGNRRQFLISMQASTS